MVANPFSLQQKRILITGASSGIGRSTAIECSRMGAELIITGRNEERLNETMQLLEGQGHLQIVLDLNDVDALDRFVTEMPKLDGVVYCAGTQRTCPVKLLEREIVDEVFETNFFSIVHLNTAILDKKKINKGASVVFVSSTAAGVVAETGNSVYSASKGAISSFAKVLALELSFRKIRVNCVMPGMIKTPLLTKLSIDSDELAEDEKRYPLGYGEPSDVAYAIVYLLSDAARWVTGTNILLDGGLTLH